MQNVMSPGSANWDLSVDKTWKYAERYGLTLRTDIFNAFNRPNFTGLDTAPADGTFGDVTSANAAREIQLSLRFEF